jgi:2-(1,2-epoxy-1,2-dihydrophenyl)acetyl-CoA isomerase
MSDASPLLRTFDRGVLHLTLNRPESLNALNGPMVVGLRAALDAAVSDPDVGVVLLSGAGRAFCSGGDLRSGATERPAGGAEEGFEPWSDSLRHAMEISRILHHMPKPTVAMVRGAAAGAGLAIAAACDIRIVSDNAVMTTAFAKVGFSGDFGITYFLTRLVGTAKARELMFLSDKLDAAEALRIGLVQRVVADAELEAATTRIVRTLADGPRIAYRYIKRNLNAAESGSLETVFDLEAQHLTRTRATEDHKEAVKAFIEKRPPVFKAR